MAILLRPVQVVAEIGCNHTGDLDLAKKMIRIAARDCGADVVKFQKRCPRELLTPAHYAAPHPDPRHAYGDSYGAHREFLELDTDQHQELITYSQNLGIAYSTSVWDVTSAKDMAALDPAMLKVPSASNLNYEMQAYLCTHFAGEIHVSTGMSRGQEIADLLRFYAERDRAQDLVIYACTSGYPVAFADICLFEIRNLMMRYGTVVKGIGFSGHHLGIAPDLAALALGRMMMQEGHGCFSHIERHFTLDRTWKGTDHAASLEPDGLRQLCQNLRAVDQALTFKTADILPVEERQRAKLKWGQSAVDTAAE